GRDGARALHLSRREPLHERRSDPLPPGRRGQGLAAGRPDRAAQGPPDRARRRGARGAAAGRIDRLLRQGRSRGEGRRHVLRRLRRNALAYPRPGRRPGAVRRAMPQMSMIQALNSAMDVMLARDPDVLIFGEDVGYFGGVFRATEGLQKRHGVTRCFDTPIGESGIVGVAIGMAAYGLRPIVEIQFADYIYPAYDQLVSEAARLRYRSAGEFTAALTIRAPYGGGIFGGQTHSQSPEALFTHVSGLATVIPSNPFDAKGLLISAVECDDPVIFLEPKRLYNGPFDGRYDQPVKPWA